MESHKYTRLFAGLIIAALVLLIGNYFGSKNRLPEINSYESCAAAGFEILEIYPEVCRTPDGRNFVRQLENQPINVSGSLVCLPHRDSSGPQTLECAYGLKDSTTGYYYGLSDAGSTGLFDLPMNITINVSGNFQPVSDSKYAIVGTILVRDIFISGQTAI